MTEALDTSNESSVVFNLRQLMQLEEERVVHERLAAQAMREASTHARVEREQRERQAAEQEVRHAAREAERLATEREAALLRVRLEAAAMEREQRERLAEQHARELARLSGAGHRVRAWLFGLSLLCLVITAGAISLADRRIADARERARVAASAADARAREVGALRARLASASATPRLKSVLAPPMAAAEQRPVGTQRPARPRVVKPLHRAAPPMPVLEIGDDNDPIGEL
jgi:colicin import membrane protein